ncbi:WhiB family transcriptional regulator [Actinoplanes sp. CA-054009]
MKELDTAETRQFPPCRNDPELWFSEHPEQVQAAKKGCLQCPLKARTECLRRGAEDDDRYRADDRAIPMSVWGGKSTPERRKLSRDKFREKASRFSWTTEANVYVTTGVLASVPYARMADELGVSEMAVRKQVGKLRTAGQL